MLVLNYKIDEFCYFFVDLQLILYKKTTKSNFREVFSQKKGLEFRINRFANQDYSSSSEESVASYQASR